MATFNQDGDGGWGHNTNYATGVTSLHTPYSSPPSTFDDGHNCCIDEIANRPNIVVNCTGGNTEYINGTYTWYGSADGWNSYGAYCQNGSRTSPTTGAGFNNTVCIHKNGDPSSHGKGNWVFARALDTTEPGGTFSYNSVNAGGTGSNSVGAGPTPFSISGPYKELQCCSQNLGNGVKIYSTATYTETDCETGTDSIASPSGNGCGDPHIFPLFGEKYDL